MKKIKRKRVVMCECGSGRGYKVCCRSIHQSLDPASCEQLVRARFCAFKRGLAHFLIQTTDPQGPLWRDDDRWESDLLDYPRDELHTLEILSTSEDDARGTVTFSYTIGEETVQETSTFRFDQRWLYVEGVLKENL